MMKKLTSIVAAVDHNEEVDDILATAGALAKATNAELHLVHVYSSNPELMFMPPYAIPMVIEDADDHEEALQAERQRVREMANRLREEGVRVTGHMKPFHHGTAKSILEFTESVEADLLVIGTHRRGRVEKILLGTVSETLVRKAGIPVLVVPRH